MTTTELPPACEAPGCDNDADSSCECWPPRELFGREVSQTAPIGLCSLHVVDLEVINPSIFSRVRACKPQRPESAAATFSLDGT
ncbi:hypothetical protein [Dactylosporangium sp. CA-139066]|uniref:hypothetical protein n=1 Tax=Dactylosporangium sp. CA-139066 TaxID=3239930 RepID=UPI003D92999D